MFLVTISSHYEVPKNVDIDIDLEKMPVFSHQDDSFQASNSLFRRIQIFFHVINFDDSSIHNK